MQVPIKKHTFFFLLTAICSMLLLSSCKTTQEFSGDLKKRPAKFLVAQLEQQQIPFDWFSAKAKIKFTEDGKTQSVTANIRMKKDSIIWLTLSKIGYEAARMVITPDSVKFLLRKEKEYYEREFRFFLEEYALQADFKNLQALIMGNALNFEKKKMDARLDPPFHLLISNEVGLANKYWQEEETFRLRKMEIREEQYGRTFNISYDKYQQTGENDWFAFDREAVITSAQGESVSLEIHYSKVILDEPVEMPFVVSSHYSRK